ncbi:SDR family NAD(P)-dependent oxidoreductase [Alginatibacterium sediminis]|uniref:SDR family NAD(P)-dependent oxidoreductase n=1 Tax=Alginatibacterium sediminis TaxID=2164068 RepID=UPI0013146A20|nr:SDR family NAD(P)-dependent oxidoreductase [Alginatibacterium sediminis]
MRSVQAFHRQQHVKHYVVVGGSSTIAQAIISELIEQDSSIKVIVISRSSCPDKLNIAQVHWTQSQYDEQSLSQWIKDYRDQNIVGVFICNGQLQSTTKRAEKSLSEFNCDSFLQSMTINCAIPLLALQQVILQISPQQRTTIVVFNARVGSISDNNLGGWYSYRAAKAALNMALKTAAIEFARTHKHLSLISFHPGTIDSPLSRPYQSRLKKGQLRLASDLAKQLLLIVKLSPANGELSFIDWRGDTIGW